MPIDPKLIVGTNLTRIRKSCGLSQEELAERAGLHRTYVSGIERGKRNVSVENLFVLAKALRVAPAELLEEPKKGTR